MDPEVHRQLICEHAHLIAYAILSRKRLVDEQGFPPIGFKFEVGKGGLDCRVEYFRADILHELEAPRGFYRGPPDCEL